MGTAYFTKPITHRKKQTKGPELEEILADVARHFKKDVGEIKKKCMRHDLVLCRRIYCYVACAITNATLDKIGAVVGKDYTNVRFHRDEAAERIKDKNPAIIFDWFDYTNGSELWKQYKPNK